MEIADKNVAARGGLQETHLPFVMDLKRPDKGRFELKVSKETAIQVYLHRKEV